MKVYVLTKKSIIVYGAYSLIALFVIYFASYGISVATSSSNRLIPIYNVDTANKQIAITFDAAWGADDTDEIISIFKEHNAKATFFVLGEWVDKYPECVKALSDEGHYIASHSNTHDSLAKMNRSDIEKQLTTCNQKIQKVTGKKNKLLRAPSGDYNNNVIEVATALDMYVIQWNVDSLDYQKLSEDEIYKRVVSNAKNGDIVLFHNDVKNTPKVLPKIIKELQSQGFELVTVDKLIHKENYVINHAGTQQLLKNNEKESAKQK
ncbi:MAG: polysaccharide deacetylase family protein [Oscillospiraceae bacterium]